MLELASKTTNSKSTDSLPENTTVITETDEYGDTVVQTVTTVVHDPLTLLPIVDDMIRVIRTYEHCLTRLVTSHFGPAIRTLFDNHDRVVSGVHPTKEYGTGIPNRAKFTCDTAHLLLSTAYDIKATLLNSQRVELQKKAQSHKAPWEVLAEIQEILPDDEPEVPF